ncbi:putative MarR family transcriptional regulator [Gordonia polyisoprenivorans NBRC 16320 = JCM 10675]|uniref:MarR family transcriptional regulator n=1 Tax=Gordonia polyisoprenivorans TaxID=84595 RepID=A0A846WHN9_9ACTN|nr:MarR family transcriptional regulator [Gordonia polyisoprenivorans]MBE7194254.1 MarR family transcriptional regulator [Gordonia polyisoprenivorans]NKY01262.1 MarR family transcriptional regulator [Gordonia polyisoprenivorans]OZC29764.1 MarR family transcriptional regulator [Gordonia polyisoprenivorans]QUD81285.1 MarR family transcriptional regulator [Gordonia polyisoprenivorans]UZF58083.1 MarR family transcriptional regulator [Gordonia polyisoprenivorans]
MTTAAEGDATSGAGAASDDRAEELAAAWHDLSVRFHRIQCTLDRELQTLHQLSSSEFEVLELLWAAADHSLRMSDLAGRVHLTQSALSRVVARLDKDGLVERTMCATDRRSVFAALTDEGARRYTDARPTQRRILAEQCVTCPEVSGGGFTTT